MDLKALYELHSRLETAAVAGVNLLGEDFRLRRAIEAVEPLAKASPVIGKLYRMALDTISPDNGDRAGSLLDTLALSRALLCTQAAFGTETERPAADLEPVSREYCPCLPYSKVKPLKEALTSSGGGRYSLIMEAIKERPEELKDYRLSAAMVTALSDSYRDIAVMAGRYLAKQDKGLLPLIKEGFAEASQSEQLIRLRTMEGIGGKEENAFYVSLLEYAKKDLREEAIRALRLEPENTGLLLDLANTEKGACLSAVKQSLAAMGTEPAVRYLKDQFAAHPQENVGYIRLLRADSVSDCLAVEIERFLDDYDTSQAEMSNEWQAQFDNLFISMQGKGSPAMQDVYRHAARSASSGRKQYLRFPEMLISSIMQSADERLVVLARELAETAGKWWQAPAFAADLLTQPAKEVYDEYRKAIPVAGILGLGKEEKKKIRQAMMAVFGRINYNEESGRQECMERMEEYGVGGRTFRIRRPLVEPLDSRWYELLADSRIPQEETVCAIDVNGLRDRMTYKQILYKLLLPEQRPEHLI